MRLLSSFVRRAASTWRSSTRCEAREDRDRFFPAMLETQPFLKHRWKRSEAPTTLCLPSSTNKLKTRGMASDSACLPSHRSAILCRICLKGAVSSCLGEDSVVIEVEVPSPCAEGRQAVGLSANDVDSLPTVFLWKWCDLILQPPLLPFLNC